MTRFFSNYTAHVIKIDLEKCVGCKKCYHTCHVDVIKHNVKEFANLKSFLPQIYAEMGGTF